MAVEGFGDHPELDDEVAGEVLRLDLAALFPPQAEQRGLVIAHNDPGIRAAYKPSSRSASRHRASPLFTWIKICHKDKIVSSADLAQEFP